jgi:hypothetical protein
MSISFLVYFFGHLLRAMRYVSKASITQDVIPRCTGTERAQTSLCCQGVIWESPALRAVVQFGFAKKLLMILLLLFCLVIQLKAFVF